MDIAQILTIIWFGVIVILIVIEIMTYNLVTIWFALAAIIALIMTVIGFNFAVQLVTFVIISVILLIVTRPLLKKLKVGKKLKTNYEAVINKEGIALDNFKIGYNGNVKVEGLEWLAFSTSDDISKNERVIVKQVIGARIRVEKK